MPWNLNLRLTKTDIVLLPGRIDYIGQLSNLNCKRLAHDGCSVHVTISLTGACDSMKHYIDPIPITHSHEMMRELGMNEKIRLIRSDRDMNNVFHG